MEHDNGNFTFKPDGEEMTMVCGDCQEHVLDIDPGDTLGWLVFEARRHARECTQRPKIGRA